ncbi:MAG TPA: hypothetical protein DEQ14_11300 [Treponema sp.]|nr:hypothetical protein [Treponema sp.]
MKLLFHCCCAPCAVSCLDFLAGEDIRPELFWYNPNIHPYTEYTARLGAFKQFAALENLEAEIVDEYGLRGFIRDTFSVMQNGPQSAGAERCAVCYRARLEKTAVCAAEKGCDAFSTSLLVSPYQKHDTIRALGEELADKYGVEFFYRDFRPGFRAGQEKARGRGLYTQKYCGCVYSEEERYCRPPRNLSGGQRGTTGNGRQS